MNALSRLTRRTTILAALGVLAIGLAACGSYATLHDASRPDALVGSSGQLSAPDCLAKQADLVKTDDGKPSSVGLMKDESTFVLGVDGL